MRLLSPVLLALAPAIAPALAKDWQNLVVFGNSYADESRWNYFASHDGDAPPVGWTGPEDMVILTEQNNDTSSGGYTWPRFVSRSTGVKLYDYAVNGAACSNKITPRIEPITDQLYPSVLEYEVPAYIEDTKAQGLPSESTVYAIWIGTNDLGYEGFLTDSQAENQTVAAYVDCVYEALDGVYANGGRFFVLMNLAPLHLSPLYGVPERGGVGKESTYWPSKPDNITEVSGRMKEQVVALNQVFQYRTPYELLIAGRYPDASFALMDMHGLMSDIYYHPTEFPNITNVTGSVKQCDGPKDCKRAPEPEKFLWFDELHPSQQTDQIIADEFVRVANGSSKWALYW